MHRMIRIKKSIIMALLFGLIGLLLLACNEKANDPPQQAEARKPQLPAAEAVQLEGDDVVVARVNGSPITQYDLEQTIQSSLGNQTAASLTPEQRRKVLESLVASRAIAQAQEARLSPEELAALEKKTKAYREQLLVKHYLAAETNVAPVTQEMVVDYYERHPERFGARSISIYEMISSRDSLDAALRDRLIKDLEPAAANDDWQQWVKALQEQGYPLLYQKGQVTEKALDLRLRQLMAPLHKGEASNLSFINGKLYLVRITEDRHTAPRPLADVSAEIRKALVPVQLKKAVKQASEQVLAKSEVIYK